MKKFGYVLATKRLIEEKLPVRFMYRERAEGADSGWRFFSGTEEQSYVDNPSNIGIYDIRTILELDKSVADFLGSPEGSVYEKSSIDDDFHSVSDFDFAAD